MKKLILSLFAALVAAFSASAQPLPEGVVAERHGSLSLYYGGPTRAEGRSYNFTPSFLVYPDGKLDQAGASALLDALDMQKVLDDNYGTVLVLGPAGDQYSEADFDAFAGLVNTFNPGNLKVIGLGAGATFVNQVLAPKAAGCIAGIMTVDGKPGKKASDSPGVPAYVAGKNAAKVAKVYESWNAPHADEPLLQVFTSSEKSLSAQFAEAWDKVLGCNYRFNNEKHTYYDGTPFGKYGVYELEPYANPEALGIRRIVREVPVGDAPGIRPDEKYLWYEYWPEEKLADAPEASVPLVVLLHGNMNDPRTQAETSGFLQIAGEERIVLVEMEWQGSPNYRGLGHDGVESVVRTLLAEHPQLDPSRVYAEGLSAGSMTATALGIKKSHIFAAVGGHSAGVFSTPKMTVFPSYDVLYHEAAQKRDKVQIAYFCVFGTADFVVPYTREGAPRDNSYLNAWNLYRLMNGFPTLEALDFSKDEVFGQELSGRERIVTNKGNGIVMETGDLCKDNVPLMRFVAVMDYGHWNFVPAARLMWDYFKHFRRDPSTKELSYIIN